MNLFSTEQENFWAGKFGAEYISRNTSSSLLSSNIHFFSKILEHTQGITSVIEFGANVGLNLKAIKCLLPSINISAIEINSQAVGHLKEVDEKIQVYHQSITDFKTNEKFDLVFTKGVLIHINPEKLDNVYDSLYSSSNKYICIAEYYNPSPVTVNYRGHTEKLFKRDFAGEMLNKFKNLSLSAYGFSYHLDPQFPQDDITWFLLEK